MTEFEESEPDRAEFEGEFVKNSWIDGSETTFYDAHKSRRSLRVSGAIISSYILCVMGVITAIYFFRFQQQPKLGSTASTIASILNAVQIQVFNLIYGYLTIGLTST